MQIRKNILSLFIAFCACGSIMAQIGEARSSLAVGFNGGVALNSVGFDPSIKQKWHVGPAFGVTLRMTSEKYFNTLCALQVELNFARLGWKEDIYNGKDEPLPDTYQRDIDYVQLPFLARLGWGREHRGVMGYFWPVLRWGMAFRKRRSEAKCGLPMPMEIPTDLTACMHNMKCRSNISSIMELRQVPVLN